MKIFINYGTIRTVTKMIRTPGSGMPAGPAKKKEDKKVWDTKSASKK